MARNLFAEDNEEAVEGRNLFAAESISAGLATEADFGAGDSEVNEPDKVAAASDPLATSPRMARAQKERARRSGIEAYNVPEIGAAPELNEMSVPAFKASLALLATGDDERLKESFVEQFGDSVSFRSDSEGSTIVDFPSGSYVLNKPGISPQDIARGVFDIAAFTPAGKAASVTGAVAKSALTQAGIEGAAQSAGAGFDASNIAIAGGVGGAGKAVENLASSAIRGVTGKIPEDKAAIIAEGERRGVPVMTTDVIPPETMAGKAARYTGEAVPVVGTGVKRQAQQKAREAATQQFEGITPKYEEVVSSLRRQTNKVKRAAGDRLNDISVKMADFGEVSPSKTLKTIDGTLADLTAQGRVADDQTIKELMRYRNAINEGQTFSTLDTLRSDFREQVKGDRVSLPTRAQASIEKVYRAMTDDLKDSISGSLGKSQADKWSAAKAVYGEEMNMLKKSRLKAVLDRGDVTPESVKGIIFSQKPSEIRNLYRSLDNTGKEAMRGTIVAEAMAKATNAEGVITPTALATQLGKMRKQTEVAFPDLKGKELKGFVDLLNATRRAQEAPVFTPTGQSLTGLVAGYAAFNDLATTAGFGASAAAFARAYESPVVRNALLRVGSLPKGSAAFDRAVSNAIEYITLATQSGKRESAQEAVKQEFEEKSDIMQTLPNTGTRQ